MKHLVLLSFFLCMLCSCVNHQSTEKYQNNRNKIIYVKDKIKEINLDDLLVSGFSSLYEANEYLFVCDYHAYDKLIHIVDKKSFEHIASVGKKGEGPDEITNMGSLSFNEPERLFYVIDHGKGKILSYSIDSLLVNPQYVPKIRMSINTSSFPVSFYYISDTLCIGDAMVPRKDGPYDMGFVRWNMLKGELQSFGYVHPQIERKRSCFDVSEEEGLYVEAYSYHDLLTICDLKGNLCFNVYGSEWNDRTQNIYSYYDEVKWYGDKIIASYAEGRSRGQSDKLAHLPTKFLVFDKNGEYQCTLDVGYKIQGFVCDEENKRLIINMNDTMQFGYLDLNGLI